MRPLLLLPLLLPALGGCAAVADIGGLAAGGAAGSVTANPAVGIAVGIGVRAGIDEARRYVVRRRHRGEQDAIAAAAGQASLGESRRWEIRHTIPIGNERGALVAVRDIPNPLARCREILFTVDGDAGVFTTPLCRQAEGWKWAAAEPSVDRWGNLQ